MLFNSYAYLIFLPLTVFFYYLLPHNFRIYLLIIASCIFYASFYPPYLFILFGLIAIDYFVGILLSKTKEKKKRKKYVFISIISNFGLLFFFKYLYFFSTTFISFLHQPYDPFIFNILVPLGLSFHTFQGVSYVIEVYKKRQKAEKNFFIYTTFVLFFPQLIAGPIERPQHFLPQLHKKQYFTYFRSVQGLRLILWGLFKKIAIADHIARMIDPAFANPQDYSSFYLLLITILFSYQIYCDFSGYIDIARGSSLLLGFDLIHNFNRPYTASSVSDFWRRWNISVSSWFRDYIYIPLGGNRGSKKQTVRNYLVTFLLSGLWHGANMTFVVWGLLHGIYVSCESLIKTPSFVPGVLKRFAVFLLISLTWVFFRSASLEQAGFILKKIFFGFTTNLPLQLSFFQKTLSDNAVEFGLILLSILLLESVEAFKSKIQPQTTFPTIARWIFYLFLVWVIILSGEFGQKEFIYFAF